MRLENPRKTTRQKEKQNSHIGERERMKTNECDLPIFFFQFMSFLSVVVFFSFRFLFSFFFFCLLLSPQDAVNIVSNLLSFDFRAYAVDQIALIQTTNNGQAGSLLSFWLSEVRRIGKEMRYERKPKNQRCETQKNRKKKEKASGKKINR